MLAGGVSEDSRGQSLTQVEADISESLDTSPRTLHEGSDESWSRGHCVHRAGKPWGEAGDPELEGLSTHGLCPQSSALHWSTAPGNS